MLVGSLAASVYALNTVATKSVSYNARSFHRRCVYLALKLRVEYTSLFGSRVVYLISNSLQLLNMSQFITPDLVGFRREAKARVCIKVGE